MLEVKHQQDGYFRQFAELEKRLAGSEPAWLQAIRKAAFERFADLGFPTTRHEQWKYTSLASLTRVGFRPAADYLPPIGARAPRGISPAALAEYIPLHFYNGRFVNELSDTIPAGVNIGSLAEAFAADSKLLEKHLARYASYEKHGLV